jgi:hypothetical protein
LYRYTKYLGYVASETLAKYGVDRLPRTVAPASVRKNDKEAAKKVKKAEEDESGGGGGGGFNPFRAINNGLQKLQNKD